MPHKSDNSSKPNSPTTQTTDQLLKQPHKLHNIELIHQTAAAENIELSAEHYLIIKLLQDFHAEFNLPPSTRALINYAKTAQPDLKLDSLLFAKYFPGGIAQACLIAQIPAAPTCL